MAISPRFITSERRIGEEISVEVSVTKITGFFKKGLIPRYQLRISTSSLFYQRLLSWNFVYDNDRFYVRYWKIEEKTKFWLKFSDMPTYQPTKDTKSTVYALSKLPHKNLFADAINKSIIDWLTLPSDTNAEIQFLCIKCNALIQNYAFWKTHVSGGCKRKINNSGYSVTMKEVIRKLISETKTALGGNNKFIICDKSKNTFLFNCILCDVELTSQESVTNHVSGKAHKVSIFKYFKAKRRREKKNAIETTQKNKELDLVDSSDKIRNSKKKLNSNAVPESCSKQKQNPVGELDCNLENNMRFPCTETTQKCTDKLFSSFDEPTKFIKEDETNAFEYTKFENQSEQDTLVNIEKSFTGQLICASCQESVIFKFSELFKHRKECDKRQKSTPISSKMADHQSSTKVDNVISEQSPYHSRLDLAYWEDMTERVRYYIREFECYFCVEQFTTLNEWEMHIEAKHSVQTYIDCEFPVLCYLCKFCECFLYGLKNHIDDHLHSKHRDESIHLLMNDLPMYYNYTSKLLKDTSDVKIRENFTTEKLVTCYCELCDFIGNAVRHFSSPDHKEKNFFNPFRQLRLQICSVCGIILYCDNIYLFEHVASVNHIRLQYLSSKWERVNLEKITNIRQAVGYNKLMYTLKNNLSSVLNEQSNSESIVTISGYYCELCDFDTFDAANWVSHIDKDPVHQREVHTHKLLKPIKEYVCCWCKIIICGTLFAYITHYNSKLHDDIETAVIRYLHSFPKSGKSKYYSEEERDNNVLCSFGSRNNSPCEKIHNPFKSSHITVTTNTAIVNNSSVPAIEPSVSVTVEDAVVVDNSFLPPVKPSISIKTITENMTLPNNSCLDVCLVLGKVTVNDISCSYLLNELLANSLRIMGIKECNAFLCNVCSIDIDSDIKWNKHITSRLHELKMSDFIKNESSINTIYCPYCDLFVLGNNKIVETHSKKQTHYRNIIKKLTDKNIGMAFPILSPIVRQSVDETNQKSDIQKKTCIANDDLVIEGHYEEATKKLNSDTRDSPNEQVLNNYLFSEGNVVTSEDVQRTMLNHIDRKETYFINHTQRGNNTDEYGSECDEDIDDYENEDNIADGTDSNEEIVQEGEKYGNKYIVTNGSADYKPGASDERNIRGGKNYEMDNCDKRKNDELPNGRTVQKHLVIQGIPANIIKDRQILFKILGKFGQIKRTYMRKRHPNTLYVVADNMATYKKLQENIKKLQVDLDATNLSLFVIEKETKQETVSINFEPSPKLVSLFSRKEELEASVCKLISRYELAMISEENKMRVYGLQSALIHLSLLIFPHNSYFRSFVFGSRVTGLATEDSDVDIYLDIGGNSFRGISNGNLSFQKELVWTFAEHMRRNRNDYMNIVTIPSARVPIIKFKHIPTNLNCDLSFKSGLSTMNSLLIKTYLSIDDRVKYIICAVKLWAQYNELTDTRLFTTYALVWMVLFFLMDKNVAIVPSVLELRYNFSSPFVVINVEGWTCPVPNIIKVEWKSGKNTSKDTLLYNFFDYYSNINLQEYTLCTLTGEKIHKKYFLQQINELPSIFDEYKIKLASDPKIYLRIKNDFKGLCIQDPFDLTHNVTKTINSVKLNAFNSLCKKTVNILKSHRGKK